MMNNTGDTVRVKEEPDDTWLDAGYEYNLNTVDSYVTKNFATSTYYKPSVRHINKVMASQEKLDEKIFIDCECKDFKHELKSLSTTISKTEYENYPPIVKKENENQTNDINENILIYFECEDFKSEIKPLSTCSVKTENSEEFKDVKVLQKISRKMSMNNKCEIRKTHQEKSCQKRSDWPQDSDDDDKTPLNLIKKQRISNHVMHEMKRRDNLALLYEELAQEDEDEDEDDDNGDDDDDDLVVQDSDDEESDSEDDNSDGFHMNSPRFFKPDGTPWANDEERETFFDYVVSKAEEDEGNENETDDESEDSNESDDDDLMEGFEDVLKAIDKEDLSEEAKEDARKTRILVQSVISVATTLNKFPLEKASKYEKKTRDVIKECARLRAALIANGFPEDKLPPTITKKNKKHP